MINRLKRVSLVQSLPYILIVGSIVGFASSFIISYDKVELLKNPAFTPTCNLNPVVSCGSVMQSAQSSAFGFPNSWIGLVGFTILCTVGMALLAGAQFKRWFWWAFLGGVSAGLVFAGWLLYESIYHIQALCPFCLAVDVVMLTVFWYLLLYVLGQMWHTLPTRLRISVACMRRYHLEILVTVFLLIVVIILQHFWYYYGQFI